MNNNMTTKKEMTIFISRICFKNKKNGILSGGPEKGSRFMTNIGDKVESDETDPPSWILQI